MLKDVVINGVIHGTLMQRPSKYLIVVCHGFRTDSTHTAIVAISKQLHEAGHALFTFNFSGRNKMDIQRQVSDIHAITNHFIQYEGIILLAGSFGAISAAIAADKYPRVKGLITVNGFFGTTDLGPDLRKVFKNFRLATLIKSNYRRLWTYFKTEFKPQVISVPTLVIHSIVDTDVFIAQSERFYAALQGPKKFYRLYHADHDITDPADQTRIAQKVHDWVKTIR